MLAENMTATDRNRVSIKVIRNLIIVKVNDKVDGKKVNTSK